MSRKLIGTLTIITICLCLFSACGKEEIYRPEVGVDGYVYTTQKLQTVMQIRGEIKAAGDYVYYARWDQTGNRTVIERISLDTPDGGGKEQTPPETVRSIRSGMTKVPDYIAEKLQKELSALEAEDEGTLRWAVADDGSLIDMNQIHCFFSFLEFDVDDEENLYYSEEVLIGKDYDLTPVGSTLSCLNRDGEKVYQVYYPDMQGFVLYGEGGAYILGEGRILLIDGEGVQRGELTTEQYRGEGKPIDERLLRDAEGQVYYVLRNYRGISQAFELIQKEGGLQLEEMKGNFKDTAVVGAYASAERKSFYIRNYGNILYEYNLEEGSKKKILNWTDSNLEGNEVQTIVQTAPGELLIFYGSDNGEIYWLTKVSVEELPERETIVMFSYEPSQVLRKAVAEFNKGNDRYRIIIDDYGASFHWKTREGDASRLDLAVVSQTPPDMLDMTFLDMDKYVAKGVLEDLSPYLEGSHVLNREDFLENILEGMTVDGCLTCIPKFFTVRWLLGKKGQAGEWEQWGMEELYQLTEEHPKWLIGNLNGMIESRETLLNTFCAYYCLEKFVDWGKRECYFDSHDFARLLKWAKEYTGDSYAAEGNNNGTMPKIPEEVILFYEETRDFLDIASMEAQYGDEIVLMGYPSADGRGVYPVFISDALAITASSAHKEGAWEFIEYYLSIKSSWTLPAKKKLLYEEVKEAATQEYYSGDGPEEERKKEKGRVKVNGEWFSYYAISQEQADTLLQAIESADFRPRSEKERMILRIISEEAGSYYNGDKSIEEVIQIIQSRVNLLLQEG